MRAPYLFRTRKRLGSDKRQAGSGNFHQWILVGFAVAVGMLILGWIHFLVVLSSKQATSQLSFESPATAQNNNRLLSSKAYPVYGTHVEYDYLKYGTPQQPIQAVYALPKHKEEIKGIALLLHACTHTAYKFFSPSPNNCSECVGLSEELQIVRHVLERGYVALAITCHDQHSGCWGDQPDVNRVRQALQAFTTKTHPEVVFASDKTTPTIYAIGASSGGAMAARLLSKGMVDGALVMVMGLSKTLQEKVATSNKRSLYLAPMTRDLGTAKKVRDNYAHLTKQQQQQKSGKGLQVVLDETSCQPLPVTADYLWNRVPGMTQEAAAILVDILQKNAKHLDPATKLLTVDPTRSNWRDFVLARNHDVPQSLAMARKEMESGSTMNAKVANSAMMLWETFDLTPGKSPLAKALHRAWAFHEYCSESVPLALDLFEKSPN